LATTDPNNIATEPIVSAIPQTRIDFLTCLRILTQNNHTADVQSDHLLEVTNTILDDWCAKNKIPREFFKDITWETNENSTTSGTGCYGSDINQILLQPVLKKSQNPITLLFSLIPHEATHNYHALIRTRLLIQYPEIFKNTIDEHVKELIRNGEPNPIVLKTSFIDINIEKSLRAKLVQIFPLLYKYSIKTESTHSVNVDLNADGIKILKLLLNGEDSFIKQFEYHNDLPYSENHSLARQEALTMLKEYIEVMILRNHYSFKSSVIPECERNDNFNIPMTEEEIEKAKESLKGYLSTREGIPDARMKSLYKMPSYIQADLSEIKYYCLAYEEREANYNGAIYALEKIEPLIAEKSSSELTTEFKDLIEIKDKLKAEIKIIELYKEFALVLEEIAKAEKNIQALQAYNKARSIYNAHQTEIEKIGTETIFKDPMCDFIIFAILNYPDDHFKEHRISESEQVKLRKLAELISHQDSLREELDKMSQPEFLLSDTTQNRELLARYKSIRERFFDLTPNGIHAGPYSFYRSYEEYSNHKEILARIY